MAGKVLLCSGVWGFEAFGAGVVLTFDVFGAAFLGGFFASVNLLLSVTQGTKAFWDRCVCFLSSSDPFLTPLPSLLWYPSFLTVSSWRCCSSRSDYTHPGCVCPGGGGCLSLFTVTLIPDRNILPIKANCVYFWVITAKKAQACIVWPVNWKLPPLLSWLLLTTDKWWCIWQTSWVLCPSPALNI